MRKYYSLKYQENKIRDFIRKHKNWLDYSDLDVSVLHRNNIKNRVYAYNKMHGKDYLRELIKFKDKSGMYPFGTCHESHDDNKDCRIKLWIDDKFYKFTDKRFEQFVDGFVKNNKKTK